MIPLSSGNESYWYTATNRLQNADGPWGALTWYYDGVGNRTYEILDDGPPPRRTCSAIRRTATASIR